MAVTGQDQYYTNDGLYQLKTLQRGTLNAGKTGINGTPVGKKTGIMIRWATGTEPAARI